MDLEKEFQEEIKNGRTFLRTDVMGKWAKIKPNQKKRNPSPIVQPPYPEGASLIDLLSPEKLTVGKVSLIYVIHSRRSHGNFTEEPLNIEELSFLLWFTQRIHSIIGNEQATCRTVPSGGSRHL